MMNKNLNEYYFSNSKKETTAMKRFTLFLSLFFIIPAATALTSFAGQIKTDSPALVIHVTGFENSNGVAKVAIINSKKNYNDTTPFKGFNFKIINNQVLKTIHLPHGEYAVKVYHDENGNDELDTRIFGIPIERYGFSNNAKGTFGPPEYEDVLFKLDSYKKEINITIQ